MHGPSHIITDATVNSEDKDTGKDKGTNLLAQLREPPQEEKLLGCLVGALLRVTRKKISDNPAQKNNSLVADDVSTAGVVSSSSFSASTVSERTTPTEEDVIVQKAYLNDLCLYLSSGRCSDGAEETPMISASMPTQMPLLLTPPRHGHKRKARLLFMRLAKSHYWRHTLLFPLLRRWSQEEEGVHSVFSAILRQSVTDVIGEMLLSIDSCNKKENVNDDNNNDEEEKNICSCDKIRIQEKFFQTQGMRDLDELLKATGSFRGLCLGIDAIIRNNIFILLDRMRRVLMKYTNKDEAERTRGCIEAGIENIVNNLTQSVWNDIFSFISRTMPDVEVAFRESVWIFLMSLLSSYSGALILLEIMNSSITENNSLLLLRSQRLFIEELQRNLKGYLTVRLSSDSISDENPLTTVENILCRQSCFWRATMEVEVTVGLLPVNVFSAPLVVQAWARKLAASRWGNVLNLLQSLVRTQEATEEVPDTVETADSISSVIRKRHHQFMEEHLERLISTQVKYFPGAKHPRETETDVNDDKREERLPSFVEATLRWSTYAAEYFVRTYHPSCFTVLSLVEQDTLVTLLRKLHTVIFNMEYEEVQHSVASFVSSQESIVDVNMQEVLLQWYVQHLHHRIVQALRKDELLVMCLLRAVFVLFERIGKTNLDVCYILREVLIPVLARLCSESDDSNSNNNNNNNDNNQEEFYERQQCLLILISSGFLSFPWDLHGIRIRIILRNFIGMSLKDYFSAKDALVEMNHFFDNLYPNGHNTPEDVAGSLCKDLLLRDPFLKMLASEGETTRTIDAMEDVLRMETPIQFPAPCGVVLLMSIFRTLSLNFMRLRAEWDQQEQYAKEVDMEYLGREATFCTTRDICVFRVLIQLAHRMVLGFQLQPVGLLRLWISYINHLFTHVVPPLTEDDEIVLMASHTKDGNWSRTEEEPTSRAYKRSPNETSQGELRAALGELLADLALMPLLDAKNVMSYPSAVPQRPGSTKWLQKQSQLSGDVSILQRTFPVLVLEELYFALRIPTETLEEKVSDEAFVRQVGKMVEQSFLGVLGVFAFCQHMELFVVPGGCVDQRCAVLLQILWLAVDSSSMMMVTT